MIDSVAEPLFIRSRASVWAHVRCHPPRGKLWSPTHGFTGEVPFIRDSLPAMPGVRRGRRAPQPVLQMLSIFKDAKYGAACPGLSGESRFQKAHSSPGKSGVFWAPG